MRELKQQTLSAQAEFTKRTHSRCSRVVKSQKETETFIRDIQPLHFSLLTHKRSKAFRAFLQTYVLCWYFKKRTKLLARKGEIKITECKSFF